MLLSQVLKEMGQYSVSMADVYFDMFRMGDPYSVFKVSPPQRRITSVCSITTGLTPSFPRKDCLQCLIALLSC